MYPVCMYSVPKVVAGFSGQLGYVDTCPNQPEFRKAFCEEHCREAETQGIPSDIRKFIAYKKCTSESSQYTFPYSKSPVIEIYIVIIKFSFNGNYIKSSAKHNRIRQSR